MKSDNIPQNAGPQQWVPATSHTAAGAVPPTPLHRVGDVRRDVSDQLPLEVQHRQAAFQTQMAWPVLSWMAAPPLLQAQALPPTSVFTPQQFTAAVLLGLPGPGVAAPLRPGTQDPPEQAPNTAQKRTREQGDADRNAKPRRDDGVQVPLVPMPAQTTSVADACVEAQRAMAVIAASHTTPVDAVAAAGAAVDKLFGGNQLEAAEAVLRTLGVKLSFLSGATTHVTARERSPVLKKMRDFAAPIYASMMGACHVYCVNTGVSSYWHGSLRFQDTWAVLSYESIVAHYAPLLAIPEKRQGALCATVAHLSWLAPPWRESGNQKDQKLYEVMQKALVQLFNTWGKAYDTADKQVFLQQILAAIVPAYCSPRMADALRSVQGVPDWLDGPLREKAQAIFDDKGPRLFSMGWHDARERRVPKQMPNHAHASAAETQGAPLTNVSVVLTPAVGAAPPSASKETANQVRDLLQGHQPAKARQVLKELAQRIEQPRASKPVPDRLKQLLQEMDDCGPVDSTYMRGALHYFHTDTPPSDPWRSALRFNPASPVTITAAVNHRLKDFGSLDRGTRTNAFKATLILLSWLTPPWNVHKAKHAKCLNDALLMLIQGLNAAHPSVTSTPQEHEDFRSDVREAIMPAYCSSLLVKRLQAVEGKPPWLTELLQVAWDAIKAGNWASLFPVEETFKLHGTFPVQRIGRKERVDWFFVPQEMPGPTGSNFPPSFQGTLPGLPSGSGRLNNTAVRDMATQAMREYDTGTVEGLRDFLSRMAWLVGLPSNRDLTLEPSQRVAGLLIKLQETAIVCASGGSHVWRREQAFWDTVIEELRSPEMDALSQVMAQRAEEELDGRRQSTGATIAMFHQLRMAPPSGWRDPDDGVDSAWGGFGSDPYQGEDLEQLARSQWAHDDMFASGNGFSAPTPDNAAELRVGFQIPARGTAPVPQSVALPQTPDWSAALPSTPWPWEDA